VGSIKCEGADGEIPLQASGGLRYFVARAADMKITDSVVRSFRVARTYRVNSQKVNCVDFSPNGENAIASSDDDCIVLYDIREGK